MKLDTYLEGWEVVNMVNLGIYLKGRDVADMVKLGTYQEVVDMKAEDKPWEGMVEEDRENVMEVGMPLDYMVDLMGMQYLSHGILWNVHNKEELIHEEIQCTKGLE
ncbi:hypothetical protein NL676_039875 [Syzygium grande]|nr:hypothetical protein NL676_039875 [Syzygium grande]